MCHLSAYMLPYICYELILAQLQYACENLNMQTVKNMYCNISSLFVSAIIPKPVWSTETK